MVKFIFLSSLFLFTACNASVTKIQIQKAEEMCKVNGGLTAFNVNTFFGHSVFITCADGTEKN